MDTKTSLYGVGCQIYARKGHKYISRNMRRRTCLIKRKCFLHISYSFSGQSEDINCSNLQTFIVKNLTTFQYLYVREIPLKDLVPKGFIAAFYGNAHRITA